MALRGVGGASSTSAVTSIAVSNSNLTGTTPQSGDIVLIFGVWGGGSTKNVTSTGFAPPSGFDIIKLNLSGNIFFCLYKVAGASEPSTYTISNAGAPGDYVSAICRSYSSESATQFNTISGGFLGSTTSPGSSTNLPVNAVITTAISDLVVIAGVGNQISNGQLVSSQTWTPPSGFGNSYIQTNDTTVSFSPVTMSADKLAVASGNTGTLTAGFQFTPTANTPTVDICSVLIAISNSSTSSATVAWTV